MYSRFHLDEKLILIFLLIVFSLSLTIPVLPNLNNIIVKIFIFTMVILINLSIPKILDSKINSPELIDFSFILVIMSFLISCFYINLEENLNVDSLLSILTYVMNFVLFFLILSKNFRLNDTKFDVFTNIIIYFAIVLSIISLVYFYFGIHSIQLYSNTSAGLFGHPNTTSMFYTICIPVLIYRYFSGKMNFPVFLCILILFLTVLLFTFSRAGYIGVGTAILIYTFYRSRVLFVLVSIIVAVIAYTIVLDFATSKVDSSASRFLLILAAVSIITRSQNSLLWGYGPVNSVNVFIQEKIFYGNEPVPNPHNLLLQLTIHFGIIFTILTSISIIILLIKGMILKFKNEKFKNDQRLNLSMTIIIALIIQNFFEDVVVNPIYYVMPVFFFFCGYIYYTIKLKDIIGTETV